MTAPTIRLDSPRELSAQVLARLRWNPQVLGALAYPMQASAADPAWGVSPIDSGNHLRWSVDPYRGMPAGGFLIYRRSHEKHAVLTHRVDFSEIGELQHLTLWQQDVNEPRTLDLRHGSGFTLGPHGLEFPDDPAPLTIQFPTSVRGIRLGFVGLPGGAEVRATYGKRLMFYYRATEFMPDAVISCPDCADEVLISAPDAQLLHLGWARVPGDLAGWEPIARVPPLGLAPLDRAGVAARLGTVDLSDEDRDTYLTELLDRIGSGPTSAPLRWMTPVAEGGQSMELDAATALSLLTVQARAAWAFGMYLVDHIPSAAAADYLVVGAWMSPDRVPTDGTGPVVSAPPEIGVRRAAVRATIPEPYLAGGPALDALLGALAAGPGLLYFAPLFQVAAARWWTPARARLDELAPVATQARRQLDPQGRALLEVPLRSTWSLHRPDGLPLLAAQVTPLGVLALTAPGADPAARARMSSETPSGSRSTLQMVSPLLADLPAQATLTMTALDLFGHLTGPSTVKATQLPANLYPTAPPPIGLTAELVSAANQMDLRLSWLWGGRSRLFHPGVVGFTVDWIQDTDLPTGVPIQQAMRDGTALAWKALPRVAPQATRTVSIDAIQTTLSGQTSRAVVLREGADSAGAGGSLVAGVRTDFRLAAGGTGRLDNWTLRIGGQAFQVDRHTVGADAWIFVRISGGIAGTPFAGLPEGTEQAFAQGWTLEPPATQAGGLTIARIGGAATDLSAMMPGALVTQGPLVFGVLAQLTGPPMLALLEAGPAPQEPGAPAPPRPVPAVGNLQVDAPIQALFAALAVAPPTPAHPRRQIWVRVRTVDFLSRTGEPSGPVSADWAKAFPPVPAAGPAVVRSSPPDAFGRCKLLVRFTKTLAEHGCVLYRASDAQLQLVFARAKAKVAARPTGATVPRFTLPAGFVWPAGGPQRPEDVEDAMEDFQSVPDSMRVFYNQLGLDEGTGARPVFIDAYEARGRMGRPGQAEEIWAAASDNPLELEDTVDRAANKYLYSVKPIDRAGQEGPVSGVSLPGQGLDISPPRAPELVPVLVTSDRLIVRWRPLLDARVTRYRVTVTPAWQGGPAATVIQGAPGQFSSPLRLEGDRVALPGFAWTPPQGGTVTTLTSLRTMADGAEHLGDGLLSPEEQRFVWWCAAGNRALVEVAAVGVGTIRGRVPATYSFGVAEGSAVNPAPLVLYRGILDGDLVGLGTGVFGSLWVRNDAGTFEDRTLGGVWRGSPFLVCSALEQGEAVVLELTAQDGTRRTYGRCPAATGLTAIAVTGGVIPLDAVITARLTQGDRPSGLFRAATVTQAQSDNSPDPRATAAPDLVDASTLYRSGFVRRLRDGASVVVRWQRNSGGDRFLVSEPGGRPLRFRDGVLSVPPWNPARETLSGVYERATISVSGTTVSVPTSAQNLLPALNGEPATGRIMTLLPDRVPVRVRRTDGTDILGRYDNLVWRNRRLVVDGLMGDGAFTLSALYALEPDGQGGMAPDLTTDRSGTVDVSADNRELLVKGQPPEGAQVDIQYDNGTRQTVDPRLLEWSTALTVNDVGRGWEIRVEALCDFPNPVGVVASRVAVALAQVAPPPVLPVRVDSAQWTVANKLEVKFTPIAALVYRVEAVSEETRRRYVLADPAVGNTVTTASAADGTSLPLTETLTVTLSCHHPNAQKVYTSAALTVAASYPVTG